MNYNPKTLVMTLVAAHLMAWAPPGLRAADSPPGKPDLQPAAKEDTARKDNSADKSKSDSTPESRQKGEAVLKKVTAFYNKLKSFSFELETEQVAKLNSLKAADLKFNATFDVAVKRPNKLSIVETTGEPVLDEQSDGKNLCVYSSQSKKYVVFEAGSTAQKEFRDPAFRHGYGCLQASVLDTLLSNSPQPWRSFSPAKAIDEVFLVGQETLDGITVDKLQIRGPKFSQDIYVDQGSEPWIRQITSLDENVADLPTPRNEPGMVWLASKAKYNHPVANPVLPDSQFKFTPPAGVVKADSLGPEQPKSPLVDTAATDFTAQLAEGKTVTLSKLKNKRMVMLDFWATWCGPCRQALPLVSHVAREYKGKGLAFFAVDEQEDKAQVQEFLQKNNLDMSVVLDRDGSIGRHYRVEAIPTTVIIDRKGTIKAVHTGFNADIDRDLSRELDLVLSPKKKKD